MYATLYGQRSKIKPEELHFTLHPDGTWRNQELELAVNKLMDVFERLNLKCLQCLFESADQFWKTAETSDFNIVHGGLDPEALCSRDRFKAEINTIESPNEKRIIYYYSMKHYYHVALNILNHFLISIGDTYATLSTPNLFENVSLELQSHGPGENYRSSVSPNSIRIWTGFNFCVEKIISFLDFTTKYIKDLSDITPKMASWKSKAANFTFGNWKQVRLARGTPLCDRSIEFNIIDSLRNETVHNGTIEHYSSVYEHTIGVKVNRRFVLMPDHTNGRLHIAEGRKRFYTQDNHLNAILPSLVIKVFTDTLTSLNQIDDLLEPRWIDMDDYTRRYPEIFSAVSESEKDNVFLKYTPI